MTVERTFPVGADTVELITDGEGITAYCLVCDPPVVIGRWDEFVHLDFVIVQLFEHQDHVTAAKKGTS